MEWARIIDIIEEKSGKSVYKEVGCRSQYISDLKSGKSKNPGADFVLKLIAKFNLNPSWITTGEGDMFLKEECVPLTEKNPSVTAKGIMWIWTDMV